MVSFLRVLPVPRGMPDSRKIPFAAFVTLAVYYFIFEKPVLGLQ
jgi:hypothetical protein